MSKVTALFHIVFCTHLRRYTLPLDLREDVYRFIWNVVKQNNSRLVRIGGFSNHIHLLVDLHPGTRLTDLVRDIKAFTSKWLKRDSRFNQFEGWAKEYFAESVSVSSKDSVIGYINNQLEHHKVKDFDEELREIFKGANLPFDDRDLMA
ncbi:MAG: IS200/IS605 family transposase [Muribaculaceae bacterium]|nr:IS200/IS605 family transposase [Muribaculaceae bacterium]